MNKKKTIILPLLLFVAVFFFSGCSIRKVEEEKEELPEIKKQNEIIDIDSDGDGLSDEEEKEFGTDPNDPDSDNDGYLDGQEVEDGYNPNGLG